jgi:hypothetical protein
MGRRWIFLIAALGVGVDSSLRRCSLASTESDVSGGVGMPDNEALHLSAPAVRGRRR